jgi:hypothetical protein
MEHYYYYFVSSLPLLRLFEEAPWSSWDFLTECARNLSRADLALLEATRTIPEPGDDAPPGTMSFAWKNFETQLRNRIVRQIAGQGAEAEQHLRGPEVYYSEVERAVIEAWNQSNPLERERVLDLCRWRFIDEQEGTKPFGTVDAVCMYKIRLALVEKWNRRTVEAGEKNLDEILWKSSLPAEDD